MRGQGKIVELICPECGKPFQAHKRGNYYCGALCYQRAYKRNNKYKVAEQRNEYRRSKKLAITLSPLYEKKFWN